MVELSSASNILNGKRQFRVTFSQALMFFIIASMLLVGVVNITLVYISLGRLVNSLNKVHATQTVEHIKQGTLIFLADRVTVLTDHARFPTLVQAAMQPGFAQENLVDFISGLSVVGEKPQLALLDYAGKTIYATSPEPVFAYHDQPEIVALLAGANESYVGVSLAAGSYYWRIAVPILYNHNREGVLVAELPIGLLDKSGQLSDNLGANRLEVLYHGISIASFGSELEQKWLDIAVPELELVFRYHLDPGILQSRRQELLLSIWMVMFVVSSILAVLIGVWGDRFLARPLQRFKWLANSLVRQSRPALAPTDQFIYELASLAGDFNKMAKQVIAREEELKLARDNLEVKVLERTRALHESELGLERKVEERTKALKEVQKQMVLQEKMASVGQLASGLAHEINNPVNFVYTNFDTLAMNMKDFVGVLQLYRKLLLQVEADGGYQDALAAVRAREQEIYLDFVVGDMDDLFAESREGFRRITSIITSMRDFSRVDQGAGQTTFDLNKCVADTLVISKNEYKNCVEVRTDYGELPLLHGYPQQINQVMLNLILNAVQAINANPPDGGGKISISTSYRQRQVLCEIADNGPGIPEQNLNRVFEPFYTTKDPGHGTGLGLSISYDIVVHKHGGTLKLEHNTPSGCIFKITIPVTAPQFVDGGSV